MNPIELKNQRKRKKRNFVRQDFHKKRLKKKWLKPKGLHSKVRLRKAGHPKKVSVGYGSPKRARGLSKEGLIQVIVFNENGLEKINKEKEGIVVAKSVGMQKKIALLKKAKEKGFKVLNLNIDEYLKKKEEEIKKRLEKKKKDDKEKTKEKKEEGKKKEELEEKLSEEEKKEREKKEKDKLLTKRGVQ